MGHVEDKGQPKGRRRREVENACHIILIILLSFFLGIPQQTIFKAQPRLHSYGPVSGNAPDSIVIMLHHANAGGDEMDMVASQMAKALPNTLFLAPDGVKPSRILPGRFSWFDKPLKGNRDVIRRRIVPAGFFLHDFIEFAKKKHSIDADRIAVLGYSQGAVLALHALPQIERQISAVISFAGYSVTESMPSTAAQLPVFLSHGTDDELIPFAEHKSNDRLLREAGYRVNPYEVKGQAHDLSTMQIVVSAFFLRHVWGMQGGS